jgi:hypothetical protein
VVGFHVIEHIPRHTAPTVFKEAARVLVPGGLLILETPDIKGLCQMILNGNMGAIGHLFSNDRFPGDAHRWGYTNDMLAILAYTNGFQACWTGLGTDYHSEQMPLARIEAVRGQS